MLADCRLYLLVDYCTVSPKALGPVAPCEVEMVFLLTRMIALVSEPRD
jgi:hypothetical protein